LAPDGLDEHDTEAAVTALCLHDPDAVSGALLVAASILRI
jgi:hypothetical protein